MSAPGPRMADPTATILLTRALASAKDADEAAASATDLIRHAIGSDAVVHVDRADAATPIDTELRTGELTVSEDGRCAVFFPLVWRDRSTGVLEVRGQVEGIRARRGVLGAIAAQLAGVLAGLGERAALEREVESLEGLAGLGRELVRAEHPDQALDRAVGALSQAHGHRIAIWWADEDGAQTHVSVAGFGAVEGARLMQRLRGVVPVGRPAAPNQRIDLVTTFSRAVRRSPSSITVHATDALLVLVAARGSRVEVNVEKVGSLLGDVLPLLSASSRAAAANRSLDVGLAWTAHELRSPILGVKSALEAAALVGVDAQGAMLEGAVRELEKLAAETERILGWASGRRRLHRTSVDVRRLVEDAVETATRLDDAEVVIDGENDVRASVDPTHLRLAIANLVRNGIRYAGDGVVVTIRADDAWFSVSVRDRGPGIAADDRDRIFEPFTRGREAESDSDGAGLGLFIARRVVEAHGGRIQVEPSDDGVGATFHVVLPIDGRDIRRPAS